MDYDYFTLDNFEKLKKFNNKLAQNLLDTVGPGQWQQGQLCVYLNLTELAKYELAEGWYYCLGIKIDQNTNGAPALTDFIDLKALGEALSESWDDSSYYLDEDTKMVVTTSYGW